MAVPKSIYLKNFLFSRKDCSVEVLQKVTRLRIWIFRKRSSLKSSYSEEITAPEEWLLCRNSYSKEVWRRCFSETKAVLKKVPKYARMVSPFESKKSQIKIVITLFSARDSLTLISIHGEFHMDTFQGGQNWRRNKSIGTVCVIFSSEIFLSRLHYKQKCLDSCFLRLIFLLREILLGLNLISS